VYQHSVEITLQGSYPELLEYLAQLEKLSWQMFWGRISVDTEQYPRLRVTLTVQTLSLNKAWLIV
jgi:MSHA biogenesis protein MshJ